MLWLWIILIVIGLVLLVKGADFFVDGAAGIAGKCRISPLVIGLTVVAFGTSMPELAVSVTSAATNASDLSIGNVVGSNIANILLILGVSALICKLPVRRSSLVLDIPVLLLASVLLIGLGVWGKALEWWDGLIFLAVFSVYMFFLLRGARKGGQREPEQEKTPKTRLGIWSIKTPRPRPCPDDDRRTWRENTTAAPRRARRARRSGCPSCGTPAARRAKKCPR